MNARLRTLVWLTALVAVLAVVSWFGYREQTTRPPTGSSRSAQVDGSHALFLWAQSLGLDAAQLDVPQLAAGHSPRLLLLVQPATAITQADRRGYERVLRDGGTLVLAGASGSVSGYAESLGIHEVPIQPADRAQTPDGRIAFDLDARVRLEASDAEPLLVTPAGDWLAIRKRQSGGAVVAFASADPLLNDTLRQPDAARFIYRTLLAPLTPGAGIVFDEAHYGVATLRPPESAPSFDSLVTTTTPGRVALYVVALTFLYLLLSGRRLGPALPASDPSRTNRTMFEHVQALASLHRRARHFPYLRQHFQEYERRCIGRSLGLPAGDTSRLDLAAELARRGLSAADGRRLQQALEALGRAPSEEALADSVRELEELLAVLPHAAGGTLSPA